MKKANKQEVIENLKEELSKIDAAVLVDYRGTNCEQMSLLRRELRGVSTEIRVVKNTLLKIAAKGTPFEKLDKHYQGPTAIALIKADPVEPAKILTKYAKEIKNLEIKAGILQSKLLDSAALEELSKLPSREILLSQLLSVMQGPVRGFATALAGIPRSLATVLDALREQKEKQQ